MGDGNEVVIPYAPRPLQLEIHRALDSKRFGVLVCHRRFGKTVLTINQLMKGALTCSLMRPRFGYIAPTFRQAKSIAWDYLKHYSRAVPGMTANESELRVDYPNGGQVRLFGADNPDALRGLFFDGVVLDEFGLMQGRTWDEVILPTLTDRRGWAVFIGTPNGRNRFWELRNEAEGNPEWHLATYKASQTGVIDAEELARLRGMMSEDAFAQEFECSFEASVRGAVYAREMAFVREQGRIKDVPWEPLLPVHTAWDLGHNDSTAIWFLQMHEGKARAIDYYEASGEFLGHYVNVLKSKPYTYGRHILPHDVQVVDISEPTGRSRLEILQSLGVMAEVCPKLSLDDGIEATRMFLKRAWFDDKNTARGRDCLQNYRREENTRTGELRSEPVHDWASHGADAFRMAAIALRDEEAAAAPLPINLRWVV